MIFKRVFTETEYRLLRASNRQGILHGDVELEVDTGVVVFRKIAHFRKFCMQVGEALDIPMEDVVSMFREQHLKQIR